jgi:hypothetical protein
MRVLFVGLAEGSIPSYENRFESLVREKILTKQIVTLYDNDDTRVLIEHNGFGDYTAISPGFIEALLRYQVDSTLIAWGRVKNFDIKTVRKGMWGAKIQGDLSMSIVLYNLNFAEYAFVGQIHTTTSIPTEAVYFTPVQKQSHISALQRNQVVDALVEDAATQAGHIIEAVVRHIAVREMPLIVTEEAKNAPSLFDVFSVPSGTGAPVVKGTTTKTTTTTKPGTTPKSGTTPGVGTTVKSGTTLKTGTSTGTAVKPGTTAGTSTVSKSGTTTVAKPGTTTGTATAVKPGATPAAKPGTAAATTTVKPGATTGAASANVPAAKNVTGQAVPAAKAPASGTVVKKAPSTSAVKTDTTKLK